MTMGRVGYYLVPQKEKNLRDFEIFAMYFVVWAIANYART